MSAQYEIRFSQARADRGLQPWGVFEIVDASFKRGVSQHNTEDEAKAALAALEKGSQ